VWGWCGAGDAVAERARVGDAARLARVMFRGRPRAFCNASKKDGCQRIRRHPKNQSTFSERAGRQDDCREAGELIVEGLGVDAMNEARRPLAK
jgi:hypothetical protein